MSAQMCSRMDHGRVLNPGTHLAMQNEEFAQMWRSVSDQVVVLHLPVERIARDPQLLSGTFDVAVTGA